MRKNLLEKTKEAVSSVLPITAIVLLLSFTVTPMPNETILLFILGAVLLTVGMGFFSLGADMAMMPMGEAIGKKMTQSKKIWMLVGISFLMGVIITIAEPDLQVLANQVPSIPNQVLIWTIAVGVGAFLVLAMLRIFSKIPLRFILIGGYAILFIVTLFTPKNFIAVAFDSGGVTTGPITVPFILAMGLGLSYIRSDKGSQDDSFGFIAICSIGPILAVLLLGIVYDTQDISYTPNVVPELNNTRDVGLQFMHGLPEQFHEVLMALIPIIIFFVVFQIFTRYFRDRQLSKAIVGFVYTLIGLVLFLTGVNVGFIPVGTLIGSALAASSYKWLLVPLGVLIGYFIVAAEPAVHVLNKQVENVSNGAISQKVMLRSLAIGVSLSLALSMVRALVGFSVLWFIVPGYIIAIVLSFFVPEIFTGIAFDSGGVVTGPMTTTFLLPLTMGVCESVGGDMLTDAFGVVGMIAMIPLITIQLTGLIYQRKMDENLASDTAGIEDEIIEFEQEGDDE